MGTQSKELAGVELMLAARMVAVNSRSRSLVRSAMFIINYSIYIKSIMIRDVMYKLTESN